MQSASGTATCAGLKGHLFAALVCGAVRVGGALIHHSSAAHVADPVKGHAPAALGVAGHRAAPHMQSTRAALELHVVEGHLAAAFVVNGGHQGGVRARGHMAAAAHLMGPVKPPTLTFLGHTS